MGVTHTQLKEKVFALVASYDLVWNGLYQGRTGCGGHTIPDPAKGYDPETYGNADWNVRLVDGNAKPAIWGYGGAPTVAEAVVKAIAFIEREREKRKQVSERVVIDRKLLRSLGVRI